MSRILQGIKKGVLTDLKFQFAQPTKSLAGYLMTTYWERQNRLLVERVVSQLNINPDSKVLEIGYGRGYGLELCHSVISSGKGSVFGIETSGYMRERAFNRFMDEIMQDKSITLDSVPILCNMPYPTRFFDSIFHVDVFYFWSPGDMRETCHELFRILKPGGRLLCGMELNRLRRLENYGVLKAHQYDPMTYMIHLEPSGFREIKVEYQKIDGDREIQLISAYRPEEGVELQDADTKMRDLERQIKRQIAMQHIFSSQNADPELRRQLSTQDEQAERPEKAKLGK